MGFQNNDDKHSLAWNAVSFFMRAKNKLPAIGIVEKVTKLFFIKRNSRWNILMFNHLYVGRERLIVDNDWRYPLSFKNTLQREWTPVYWQKEVVLHSTIA